MPTVKRSKGIEMQEGTVQVEAAPVSMTPEEMEAISPGGLGPQFLEKCQLMKKPSKLKPDVLIFGLAWTLNDIDSDGVPHSYVCDDRAMKIAANARAEKGEQITPQTQWLLFRMGALIGSGYDIEALLKKASEI